MVFNDRDYTQDAIIKQASLIELHSKDGSAMDAGCSCIEGKHLHVIEGLAEEGKGFAVSEKEKMFYDKLGNLTRSLRKNMEGDNFDMQEVLHEAGLNPYPRKYEPHGKTECERAHPEVLRKISSCVKKLEKKHDCAPPYIDCPVNPVAVCRASIKCVEGSYSPRKDVTKITEVDYPSDMGKKPAVSLISLDTGKISVHLNPKLKENPTLEKAVLEHELREGSCIYNATIDCHNKALKHEPKGTRKEIHALGLGHA